jgi:hypothetical protein
MFASFHPHSMWGRWPHEAVGHMWSLATWGRWPHRVVGMSVPVIRAVSGPRAGVEATKESPPQAAPAGKTLA